MDTGPPRRMGTRAYPVTLAATGEPSRSLDSSMVARRLEAPSQMGLGVARWYRSTATWLPLPALRLAHQESPAKATPKGLSASIRPGAKVPRVGPSHHEAVSVGDRVRRRSGRVRGSENRSAHRVLQIPR